MDETDLSASNTVGALPGTPVILAFVLSIFLAGSNAIAVSFTVAELDPFWGAAIRFAAATAIFALIILIRRVRLPRGRTLAGVLLYGTLNFGLSFALIYSGIREMTAGFATIILALTPLLTFLFAVLHRLERFRWRALAGALLALAGIALAFAGQTNGSVPLWSVLFMIGGAACFAEATVVIKMLPEVSPAAANGLGMLAATVLLFVLSLLAGEAWIWPQKSETQAAIIYLILFGSVVLFYLSVYVVQHWTASASSYLMVLSPFVTVPLGAVLAGEEVTAGLLGGALLVVAGALVGVLSKGPVRQTRLQSTSADS